MDRRQFILACLAWGLAAALPARKAAALLTVLETDLFDTTDPEIKRLADEVMRHCVLGKVRPPEGTLKHRWLQAGTGDAFYGQWIWDTMFIVDLLALVPGNSDVIRDIFQNYWDFQERWNAVRPDYAHDMIPCMIEPRNTEHWNDFPAYSQIPILAWGMERVFKRTGDRELLKQGLAPLERFHEWYWRERDVTGSGLLSVGSYSGVVQHARFETFDYECNLDDLKLTPHPTRPGTGDWYGDVCLPGMTGYLIASERALERMAGILGDSAMAKRRRARIAKSAAAVRKHMWDEPSGTFLAVKRDSLEKIPVATIGSWMPMLGDVPTRAMQRRMAEAIQSDHWQTPLPVPTVDRKDKRWVSNSYWRGDVWPATNYQVATAFAHSGFPKIAADIADKSVANALANGVNEHYDSITGKPLGVPDLGMTCTVVTMMLDGLTSRYRLKLRSDH